NQLAPVSKRCYVSQRMKPRCAALFGLYISSLFLTGLVFAQDERGNSNRAQQQPYRFAIPRTWTRRGVVLERHKGEHGVSGDPCIVWDETIRGWRMVLFYDPPGHGQAVCTNRDNLGSGQWKFEGPLPVTNPEAVGGFHKPFIVMNPNTSTQA